MTVVVTEEIAEEETAAKNAAQDAVEVAAAKNAVAEAAVKRLLKSKITYSCFNVTKVSIRPM